MNLYEFEGKNLLAQHGIQIPRGIVVHRGDDIEKKYTQLGIREVVLKAQVLAGKRAEKNGIRFCSNLEDVIKNIEDLFTQFIQDNVVTSVLIEEKITILEEHYFSILYNTSKKQPMILYNTSGGTDIEKNISTHELKKIFLDIRQEKIEDQNIPYLDKLWECFLTEDIQQLEINPLVRATNGLWLAVDAKITIDDDAFFRHPDWKFLEPRTLLGRLATEREIEVKKIDEGENYYRGTAGKYIELDGTIAVLFSGGGSSLANMDALTQAGLKAANYTEYSGNPPRNKVYQLTKIVLSKPGIKGLWIVGGVANFTNIEETFHGIVDALDEIKPRYPIVVRKAGPFEKEGMRLMKECARRNHLQMKLFGKEIPMNETIKTLKLMINTTVS